MLIDGRLLRCKSFRHILNRGLTDDLHNRKHQHILFVAKGMRLPLLMLRFVRSLRLGQVLPKPMIEALLGNLPSIHRRSFYHPKAVVEVVGLFLISPPVVSIFAFLESGSPAASERAGVGMDSNLKFMAPEKTVHGSMRTDLSKKKTPRAHSTAHR